MLCIIESLPEMFGDLAEEVRVLSNKVDNLSVLAEVSSNTIEIDEVCRLTGYKKGTIYQFVHSGSIPFHKRNGGSKLIFFKDEILEWLKAKKNESTEQFIERKENELVNSSNEGA